LIGELDQQKMVHLVFFFFFFLNVIGLLSEERKDQRS